MTAIHGYIKPSRRPGELGIHSVDHFHFAVPDLAVGRISIPSSASMSQSAATV